MDQLRDSATNFYLVFHLLRLRGKIMYSLVIILNPQGNNYAFVTHYHIYTSFCIFFLYLIFCYQNIIHALVYIFFVLKSEIYL